MINQILKEYRSVSLEQISSVSLMNRIDTKYIMNRAKTEQLLEALVETHAVVEIESRCMLPYKTLYFDTEDFSCYHSHHNGKLDRYKYRTREYLTTNSAFCEMKHKSNKGKTLKKRVARERFCEEMDTPFRELISAYREELVGEYMPQLLVTYTRITLVDYSMKERLTIDLDLSFVDYLNRDRTHSFENLVIVESKREQGDRNSISQKQLRELRCVPMGFSKYCVGIALLKKTVKKNRFKEKVRRAQKIEVS